MAKAAPLNTSFMLAGILGFLVSVVYIYPKVSQSWGAAFAVVFFAMILASLLSMIRAPAEGQLMPKLERDIKMGERMSIPAPPPGLKGFGAEREAPARAPRKKAKKKAGKKAGKKKKGKKKRK